MPSIEHPKDVMGRFITQSLFFELTSPAYRAEYNVQYTIKENDHEHKGKTYLSLRQIYLSYNDITEYSFAKEVFGSWEHWKRLKASPFFKPHYASWREELEVKIQAMGIAHMREEVLLKGKAAGSSAKWLAEKGWDTSDKRGRPSKAKVKQEAARMDRVNEEVDEMLGHAETIRH